MHNNQIMLKISEVLLSSQGQVNFQIAQSDSKFAWKFQYVKKLFSKILRAPLAARAPWFFRAPLALALTIFFPSAARPRARNFGSAARERRSMSGAL